MTVEQKREELKKAYPNSTRWTEKVSKMSDAQVVAIYARLSSTGRLGK